MYVNQGAKLHIFLLLSIIYFNFIHVHRVLMSITTLIMQ